MASAPDRVQRLRLVIAYDGRTFVGWQSQTGGNTVQDKLEAAVKFLCVSQSAVSTSQRCPKRIIVHGSGRTDSGVHARGQVAHVDLPSVGRMTPFQWCGAINAHLPAEIRVESVRFVSQKFHARFDARGKTYLYRIWNAPVFNPFEIGRAWHLPGPLDLDILQAGADRLIGRHNFAGFAANRGKPDEDTTRTIERIRVKKRSALVTIEFTGDGFLYKMVRLLTGSLVRCAQGRNPLVWIDSLLQNGSSTLKTNFAAPAEGLYLMRVYY